jgi:hypothetical protein
MLVQYLLVERPFSATFGKHGKAWKTFVVNLSKVEDPDGRLVFGVQGIGEKAVKKRFEDQMVFGKGNVDHVSFESGSNDTDDCNELLEGLKDLLEIVTCLKNVRSVTSSQTAAKKNEDRARADALRNASLGFLTAPDKQLIKSSKVVEVEPSSAKKQPANNSPSEIICILGNTSEHLKYRMEIKAQKEARKDRRLKLKGKHKKQQQCIDLQKLELQKWAAESQQKANESQIQLQAAVFVFIQEQ